MKTVRVKCYSGYTYPQEPRSFEWGGAEHEIAGIESAWQEPGKRVFRVRDASNKYFILCYNELSREWMLREVRGER